MIITKGRKLIVFFVTGIVYNLSDESSLIDSQKESEHAKTSPNPVGDLISLTLRNYTLFRIGSHGRINNHMSIQPIIPISLRTNWVNLP